MLDLPFLFDTRAHMLPVCSTGRSATAAQGAGRLEPESARDLGGGLAQSHQQPSPITTAADIRGLKIRTTPNPAHVKAFQLLGAVPTPMPFTELFNALEQKTVDGQENPVTLILNAKFFEVQKHVSLTRHAFTSAPLVMNRDKFAALAPDLQAALATTATEMAAEPSAR